MSDKTLVERLREASRDYAVSADCIINEIVGINECVLKEEGVEACQACMKRTLNALADAIEREYLPRPRFEDGEPVKFGDEFINMHSETFKVNAIGVDVAGPYIDYMLGRQYVKDGERVKRPEPEVLDADGVPIRVGDTVYHVETGRRYEVTGLPQKGSYKSVQLRDYIDEGSAHYDPPLLTHNEPDSLERIEADAQMNPIDYVVKVLHFEDHSSLAASAHHMLEDLLRRQREVLERGAKVEV